MNNTELINRSKTIIIILLVSFLFGVGIFLMVGAPGIHLTAQALQITQIVGSFLAVTITTEFLYTVLIRPVDDYKLEIKLGNLIESKFDSMFSKSIYFGFQGFEDPLDFCKLFKNLDADNTLWWLDTYDPHYKTWLKFMEDALKRGVKINILALNPDSDIVKMRAAELGQEFGGGVFKAELTSFINCLTSVQMDSKYGKNLKLVKYDGLPCAPIYIIDKEGKPIHGYSSYFLGIATGVGFPHMRWSRQVEGGFLAELSSYVMTKWEANLNLG
jgi:hypothetical protein